MPSGRSISVGDGKGELIAVRVGSRTAAFKLAMHPDLYVGECFMDGSLVLERGSIRDLLDLLARSLAAMRHSSNSFVIRAIGALQSVRHVNARHAATRNVAHHYDLSEAFFRSFLDSDMQYSCAYFQDKRMSLDEAQQAKLAHIAAKLALRPGQRVLDIGCGWGGLAIHLAQHADVRVHGISLSKEQLKVCRERTAALGLCDRVTFGLTDYRDVQGPFDRIVSVGMFEHVGTLNYKRFFDRIEALLAPSGVALIHSIGRSFGPSYTSAFFRKYIFPGGYAPALSQVVPHIEHSHLRITDIEILRLHYAETLRRWRERFIATALPDMDPGFKRMWDFYLAASEMSFRHMGFMVFQAQMTRQVDVLPITRDYMAGGETREVVPVAAAEIAA